MAKKKLNRRFAAIVVISVVSVCGAAALTYFVLVQRVRPAQHRAAGMAALEKGDYKTAFNQLGPVLPRFMGDADFLRALYRSETHMTSLRPELYGHSRTLLENITTARPDDLDAMKEKLRVDLDYVDRAGVEQLQTQFTDHLRDVAGRLLKREPANVDALRADAVARVAPYFDPAAAPASADVRATLDALAASLKAAPDEPDLVVRYAQAAVKLRDALVREHAAEPGPNDPQAKALADDVEHRIDALDAIAADAGRPADRRAVAAYRVAQAEETCRPLLASPDPSHPTPAEEASGRRAGAALARVVELATAKDVPVIYVSARRAQAMALARQNKADEGERLLREAVEALPNQWTPRLNLAQYLTDRGKSADAVEVLSAKLEPSTDLVGLDGVVFVNESYGVPLQRALARVAGLSAMPADKRDAAIAAAEEDYKIASARVPETDARMMMTRASIQDARRDRTGAIQTLDRAVTAATDEPTRLKILSQLVSLNLAMGQTGAAADALAQIDQRSNNPLVLLQLIQLNARNGHLDVARQLLARAHQRIPGDNPAIAALDLQFAPDAQTRKQLLDKYPENTPQTAMVKLRLAAEGGDLAAARQVGDRAAKAFANDAGVMVAYADVLLRAGDRAAAVPLLQAAQKLKPDDKQVAYLLASASATSTTQQAEIRDQYVDENVTDPYRRALIEAEKARLSGNEADYVAKLEAADALDKAGDGSAAERLFLRALAIGKVDEAQKWLDRVAAGQRDPAQVRALKVRLMIGKGDLDAAQAAADQLASDVPNFAGGQLVRGLALLARNHPDDALKALDAALASEPGNVETIRVAIGVADRLNQPATFKRLLDQGLALAPRDPQFIDAALRYESMYGDPSKTIDARTKLRDAAPNAPGGWLNLVQAYADSAAKAGDAKTADGYRAKALATANEAAGKFPNEPAVLLAAARMRGATGDRAGADALAGRLAAEPAFAADPQTQAQLGGYYAERGQNAEAVAAYERLIATGKAGDDVKYRVAQLKAAANDAAGATAALDSMSKPTPQAPGELRVNLMLAADQLPEAQKYADAQLAAERSSSNLLLSAFLKARAGDLAAARSLADEAVKTNPDDAASRLARVRFALAGPPAPDNARLIEDLEAIKKADSHNADARLLLVERLSVAGRPDDARSELESIVTDVPGQAQATARLIGLLLNDRPLPANRIETLLADAERVAGPNDPGLLNLESGVALALGDNARASKAAIAAAAAAPPADVEARRRLYATLLRTGDAASLLAEVDKHKDADASAYWHHVARGIALHRLKRDAEAAPEFERALGLAQSLVDDAPVDEVAATYAGEYGGAAAAQWLESKMPEGPRRQAAIVAAYESRQEHDAAAKAGEGLIGKVDALSPQTRAQALTNLGTSNLAATPPRAAEARAAFEKLSAIDPQNFMTLNNLAYAMTLEGSNATPDQAVDVAKRAYDALDARGVTGEARAYVGDTYGWTLIRAGKLDEGTAILQQARQVRELPEIDYHLGEAAIARKQGAAALESLQNALEKVRNAKQNHTAVDPALEGRVTDAIRRAQALQ